MKIKKYNRYQYHFFFLVLIFCSMWHFSGKILLISLKSNARLLWKFQILGTVCIYNIPQIDYSHIIVPMLLLLENICFIASILILQTSRRAAMSIPGKRETKQKKVKCYQFSTSFSTTKAKLK